MRGDIGEDFAHVVTAGEARDDAIAFEAVGRKDVRISKADCLEYFVNLALGEGFAVGKFSTERAGAGADGIALAIQDFPRV
jgi:hypothetical protein